MNYDHFDETIVALSTPVGKGAIAVIRMSGSGSLSIINHIFSRPITRKDHRRAITGEIVGAENNEPVDECVIVLFCAPHSYTGEDVVEISCHGNPIIVDRIIQEMIRQGARVAQPGEFTRRAFLNHKLDLSQAEAVAGIIEARTRQGVSCSLRQLEGGISRKIDDLKQEVIQIAALIEVNLDFNEDDIQVYQKSDILRRTRTLISSMDQLLQTYEYGRLMREGLKLLLLGKPNVGKSSLLNALLEKERAIVSEIPGTTRDYIEEYTQIEGFPIQIVDTAGIRETLNRLEEMGVRRALQHIESADLVLAIFDVHQPLDADDLRLLERLRQEVVERVPLIVVLNKADLGKNSDTVGKLTGWYKPVVAVSAKTGDHIDRLKREIKEILLGGSGTEPEGLVISSARHKQALSKARESLQNLERGIQSGLSEVILASELRSALDQLGEIVGEVSNEDLLNHIFSQFCVGK